ncbi:hypothetical protein RYH74_08350 [Pseudomonas sp. LSJ-87]|uniref:hypothetical protein n=1 Tax=Pseudomonas sp. LSJ-87 TaxID=3079932 RepID=UPI0029416CAF|nr:hypothetical protein [Pseudomonas sp. LSJ-87]MDV5097298.1 hypothetical protein [Pseudomonas sp. LSJ-87]
MEELRTTAGVFERLSQNQDALLAAVEDLAKWDVERGATTIISKLWPNVNAVRNGIAELVAASVK